MRHSLVPQPGCCQVHVDPTPRLCRPADRNAAHTRPHKYMGGGIGPPPQHLHTQPCMCTQPAAAMQAAPGTLARRRPKMPQAALLLLISSSQHLQVPAPRPAGAAATFPQAAPSSSWPAAACPCSQCCSTHHLYPHCACNTATTLFLRTPGDTCWVAAAAGAAAGAATVCGSRFRTRPSSSTHTGAARVQGHTTHQQVP
jgi:hypothetical protein